MTDTANAPEREAGTPGPHEPDYKTAMLYHSDRADAYMGERDALTAELAKLRAALADYERRILSAVEAVPASQIRAEALREAAALVDAGTFRTNEKGDFCGHDIEQHEYCDECLSKQILALIDAPKVTT